MSIIITIDGPAGSGKSTVAKRLARELRIPYIDTGAMYRSVAYRALQQSISLDNEEDLLKIAENLSFRFELDEQAFRIYVKASSDDQEKLLGPEIRSPEVSMGASQIAQYGKLRACLVAKQQQIGRRNGGVLEGRDAGTVIFPDAPIKFFLTASAEVRAERRYIELKNRMGEETPSFEKVLDDVNLRDQQDQNRQASPLKPAPDAIIVDTSGLDENGVFDILLEKIQKIQASQSFK